MQTTTRAQPGDPGSTYVPWGMLAAMSLVVLSLAINLWGVMWSRLLGW